MHLEGYVLVKDIGMNLIDDGGSIHSLDGGYLLVVCEH